MTYDKLFLLLIVIFSFSMFGCSDNVTQTASTAKEISSSPLNSSADKIDVIFLASDLPKKPVTEFKLINNSKSAVEIKNISKSCGCLEVKPALNKIEPGSFTTLQVFMQPIESSMTVEKNISCDVELSNDEHRRFSVHVQIQPDFLAEKSDLETKDIRLGQTQKKQIRYQLCSAKKLQSQSLEIHSNSDEVKVIEKSIPKLRERRDKNLFVYQGIIEAEITPKRQNAYGSAELIVTENNSDKVRKSVYLKWNTASVAKWAIQPERIVIRNLRELKKDVCHVQISNSAGTEFKITGIDSNHPEIINTQFEKSLFSSKAEFHFEAKSSSKLPIWGKLIVTLEGDNPPLSIPYIIVD